MYLVHGPIYLLVCVALLTSGAWEAAHCNGGRTFICEAPLP